MDRPLGRVLLMTALVAATLAAGPAPLSAEDAIDLASLSRGPSTFPLIWQPYRERALPPIDGKNSPDVARQVANGTLHLSMREFLQLVVENNLDLLAARYGRAIAQIDILRAQSGQAARGTAEAPLPGSLFAGAIGAGVSTTAGLSPGGTGGAAIASQGKLFTLGPRGNFDPTVSMNFSYDHVVTPLNTTKVAGAAEVTVPSTVLQTKFQQELPIGTSYAVSFNLQRQTSTQAGLLFNPALTSFFAFQVYQPLLNGFGLALNRRFVTVANNDRKMVVESFHTTLNNTLASAANAYLDLMAFRENVAVAQRSAAAAEQQVNDDRQQVELETMTPLDLMVAESQLASARVRLVTAETSVRQQEVLLKTLMTRAADPAVDAATIEPTDRLPDAGDVEVPPLDRSIEEALAKRSSVHQAELGMENQHITEAFTRKNMLPTLSVFAAFDSLGLAPRTPSTVRQLWQAVYPEYSVGFTLAIPVFNRAAQADDLRARLEAQSAEAALQRTRSDVAMQVRTATVNLSRGRAQIDAAERAVAASRTAYEGAQERQRAGIGTAYQVTLADRDLIVAESAAIQARVNCAKALVAHEVSVSSFLERHGIVFDEALRGTLLADRTSTASTGKR